MGYDRVAPKRPVNMTLNEDLVRRARAITPNLSEAVEIAAHIAANDAFVAKYGSLADEFSSL